MRSFLSQYKKLKEFQAKSVKQVIKQLDQRPVYAIADEVGLGKTLMVAETIFQEFLKFRTQNRKRKGFNVFYVAPSYELIIQNIHTINKYISGRLKELDVFDSEVLSYTSRLTMLVSDSEKVKSKSQINKRIPPKYYLHIIGLTPQTSFEVSRKGKLSERALLARAFSLGCKPAKQKFIRRWWYALPKQRNDEEILEIFNKQTLGVSNRVLREKLKRAFKNDKVLRANHERIFTKRQKQWAGDPEYNKLIGVIRKRVIETLIYEGDFRSSFLVLDEWHRYSDSCLNPKKGIYEFIKRTRDKGNSKTLLVSATPFQVNFPELFDEDGKKGRLNQVGKNHFEDLFKLIYEESALKEYKAFTEKRSAYLKDIANFIEDHKNHELREAAHRSKENYIKCLKKIVIRNERPKQEFSAVEAMDRMGSFRPHWGINKKQLKEFLDLYPSFGNPQTGGPTRSPVLSMFQDGGEFPGYYPKSISSQRKKLSQGWKIQEFKKFIEKQMSFDIFSPKLPPLWIPTGLNQDKSLIFSRFRFSPEEISGAINREMKTTKFNKKPSGTIFQNFPVKDRRLFQHKRKYDYHWLFFYAPLCFEYFPKKRLRQQELDAILTQKLSVTDTLKVIEEKLLDGKANKRLEERFKSLELHEQKMSPNLKEMFNYIFVKSKNRTLGVMLSTVLRNVFNGDISPSFKTEKNILLVSYWFHRLFVSNNAALLFKEAVQSGAYPKRLSRKGSVNLDFVYWYSERFKFIDTFTEYLALLAKAYSAPEDMLAEFCHSMALKPSSKHGRFFRPFLDSKNGDSNEDDGGEGYSQKTIRNAFNSPFPPYVLISTSVGQEGLDFHRYCSTIIHWSPPHSPAAMQQREGRIDRYLSLQVRKAHTQEGLDIQEEKLEEKLGGLHPFFTVIDENGKRKNMPRRYVLFMPFSSQAATWHRCMKRMFYNDLLIGHPDPISVEKVFSDRIETLSPSEKEDLYGELKELFIKLAPS